MFWSVAFFCSHKYYVTKFYSTTPSTVRNSKKQLTTQSQLMQGVKVYLYDADIRAHLLPLTYFKPVSALRFGILTQLESWQLALNHCSVAASDTLQSLQEEAPTLYIHSGLVASETVLEALESLTLNTRLDYNGVTLAVLLAAKCHSGLQWDNLTQLPAIAWKNETPPPLVTRLWHMFAVADCAIKADFKRLTSQRESTKPDPSVLLIGSHDLFLEKGARAQGCSFNTTDGPIYLGADAEVMEGTHIRGPFAMGEHAVVKMGCKIYGATSIGTACKVGGELSNVILQDYTNKAHDGFIGNALLGSWCNLGADTNASNLKNTYEEVRIWSVCEERFVRTGTQFCGLIMGDHSKTGINTMFNTGTVVGAFCNIFGNGFPRTWIPSFSWGGASGFERHDIKQALETAKSVMARRGVALTESDKMAAYKLYNSLN